MLRPTYSIILALSATTIAAVQQPVYAEITTTTTTSTATQFAHYKHSLVSMVPRYRSDIKFWNRSTEYGERDNWRQEKPCTLLERIRLNEQTVISMGATRDNSGGALETNIKELVLPSTGILLLNEDSISGPIEVGRCLDTQMSLHQAYSGVDDNNNNNMLNEHLFEFEIESDDMSWFSPDNWRSEFNEGYIYPWIPDSHRIPCSRDTVVFGIRNSTSNSWKDSKSSDKPISFKVNFRPSEATFDTSSSEASSDLQSNIKVDGLRVSKLFIGNYEYSQLDFQELINSDQYKDIIFLFNDSKSVLRAEDGSLYPSNSMLTIDESSFRLNSLYNYCADEAGCLCGNENVNIMKAICSFSEPVQPDEQPCYDPVTSSGYCNKICATVLTLSMDPTRFKEEFITSMLGDISLEFLDKDKYYILDKFLVAARRIKDRFYEITFRHVPHEIMHKFDDLYSYHENNLDREREFVQIFLQKLTDAKRTFFGIKVISIKSSSQWRKSNRDTVFCYSFAISLILLLSLFIFQELHNERIDSHSETSYQQLLRARDWFIRRLFRLNRAENDEVESFLREHAKMSTTSDGMAQESESTSQIPLIDLNSKTNDDREFNLD